MKKKETRNKMKKYNETKEIEGKYIVYPNKEKNDKIAEKIFEVLEELEVSKLDVLNTFFDLTINFAIDGGIDKDQFLERVNYAWKIYKKRLDCDKKD